MYFYNKKFLLAILQSLIVTSIITCGSYWINKFGIQDNLINFIMMGIIIFFIILLNLYIIMKKHLELNKKIRKAGIKDIFFSRDEFYIANHTITSILENAQEGSDIFVYARSGIAWSSVKNEIKQNIQKRDLHLLFNLSNPAIKSNDWARTDLYAALENLSTIDKERIKIELLREYPPFSLVYYKKIDKKICEQCKQNINIISCKSCLKSLHYGILEFGASLANNERIIILFKGGDMLPRIKKVCESYCSALDDQEKISTNYSEIVLSNNKKNIRDLLINRYIDDNRISQLLIKNKVQSN